ncbi:MAG: transporter, partial [Myxococcaceae bacterium]|nr:transporter [Myxococcaceae bacterium]
DGRDAVLMQVYQQPTGDTMAVAQSVRALIDQERKRLPSDLRIEPWYDQSELIVASTASVRDAVCIGVALACLVLFLFLRSLRITLVALIAVPSVLAATTLLLGLLGMSFNIMTLGGMAAAVGLIIDDVIVMIEFIEARRSAPLAERPSVLVAAGELTRPLLASSTATVIVFAPLAFLSGVTGAFFKALALTMASSLVISFVVAWLLVPILAEKLLVDAQHTGAATGRIERSVASGYQWLAERAIGSPRWSLLALLPLLAAGFLSYGALGSGFMPSMDEGGFILDYRAASGTSLAETDLLCRRVEAILRKTPEVRSYSRRTGSQLGGGLTEANEGDFFVRLRSERQRAVDEVMDDVRSQVETSVPGLEIEMAQLMEDLIGDLTAVPQPIEVELFADDATTLPTSAAALATAIGKIDGVVDVLPGIVLAGDALRLEIDGVRAALEGMDPSTISDATLAQLDGEVATNVQQDPKMVGVRVWVPGASRKTIRDVQHLSIRAPDGHLFPLSRVATVSRVAGEPQITRDDLRQMVAVTGRISGRDMGSVMLDVQRLLDAPGTLPKGVTYRVGGLYAEQQKAFGGLAAVFGAAVALVFGLLLFVYESLRVALAMVLTSLLSLAAVLTGLALTGTELNISSMMGMTMVVGIVTEVAIFYVSDYRGGRAEAGIDPLVRAGRDRLRPIAMTTLAAILALLPLALALGQGASMQQPLAIAIISGLLVQIPLVLVVLPVLLKLFRVAALEPI